PPHDLFALVVVAEDEEPLTERGLGGTDHRRQLVVGRRRVAVGELLLDPDHGESFCSWVVPNGGRCGQPGRPARGCRPRNVDVAADPGGSRSINAGAPEVLPTAGPPVPGPGQGSGRWVARPPLRPK